MPAALSVDKTMTKAKQASKNKDWVTAQALYQQVLDRFPSNKRAQKAVAEMRIQATPELLQSAKAAQSNSDWKAARKYLSAAQYLAPDIIQISAALSECLVEAGRPSEALSMADKILTRDPNHIGALISRGRAFHELNHAEEAREALLKVLKLEPRNVYVHRYLGLVSRSEGNLDEAKAFFKQGIDLVPNDIACHRHFARVHKYVPDDPHINQMQATLVAIGKDNPNAALLHFALFDAFHATKDHGKAFEHLALGNALFDEKYAFDFNAELVLSSFSKAIFSHKMPSQNTASGQRIIFVTGLPRSGTTLTERILSRAKGVQACGELKIVQQCVFNQLSRIQKRENKELLQEDIQALREELLAGFAEISDGSPIMVDKMPLNFRWIGFICAALPEAKIVHLNRDPKAVAWSLFRNAFKRGGHDFIYSAENIVRFMELHRDLMDHWRSVCGSRLFDLSYSDLVTDQAGTTRALAVAMGLDWSTDWLSPEKATSHVRTASAEQVTKPVYSGSDEGWKTYETQLAPMMKLLSKAGLI